MPSQDELAIQLERWILTDPKQGRKVCLPISWDGQWSPESAAKCFVALLAKQQLSTTRKGRMLQVAIRCGQIEWVNILLLNMKASVNAAGWWEVRDETYSFEPIHIAAFTGDLDIIK
jgi:hypothetical protein